MKHLETLQDRCMATFARHLKTYPSDILCRLPGTLLAGVLPHLCQHHLNSCHQDIIQAGVDPNPVWRALFASHFKWESRMKYRVQSHDVGDEDEADWRQQYLQRYFHKLLWYQSRQHRPKGENCTETLHLAPGCSQWCVHVAQDLMVYCPHVTRLILYDSRAFNYILQQQHLYRCLVKSVEHLEIRWFRGLPGVGTFLRRCLTSPDTKLEKLTMYGSPGETGKSAMDLLRLCATQPDRLADGCPHCGKPWSGETQHEIATQHHGGIQDLKKDYSSSCKVDSILGGMEKTMLGPHSSHSPQQHSLNQNVESSLSDEPFEEDEAGCASVWWTDPSQPDLTVSSRSDGDVEDLYDIAVGAGCSTDLLDMCEDAYADLYTQDTALLPVYDGVPDTTCTCGTNVTGQKSIDGNQENADRGTDGEKLQLMPSTPTSQQGRVREIVLHDVLTCQSLVTSFCGLLKTWYSLERISISGGSYNSVSMDDVLTSLFECQSAGGRLTHLSLENELLSEWMFPDLLLSLLQAKLSNAAGDDRPCLKQLKLHHCSAPGYHTSHWRPVCWNSFPLLLSSGDRLRGVVSIDLSFCAPTLDAQPSRPLDMSALTWLLEHDTALRCLVLHSCGMYTPELVTIFNAISEATDPCKLEMLDVSFNNYRSDKASGALAQLISRSGLTCLKMEAVTSVSVSAGDTSIVTPEVVLALRGNSRLRALWLSGNRLGDTGAETLMQVFSPGGHSCLQVLGLRSNLIHMRGFHAIRRAVQEGTPLRRLLIGGNFFLKEQGGREGVECLRQQVSEVNTQLPAFIDSAALMVEHVSQM